jgi:hypothetical protein
MFEKIKALFRRKRAEPMKVIHAAAPVKVTTNHPPLIRSATKAQINQSKRYDNDEPNLLNPLNPLSPLSIYNFSDSEPSRHSNNCNDHSSSYSSNSDSGGCSDGGGSD